VIILYKVYFRSAQLIKINFNQHLSKVRRYRGRYRSTGFRRRSSNFRFLTSSGCRTSASGSWFLRRNFWSSSTRHSTDPSVHLKLLFVSKIICFLSIFLIQALCLIGLFLEGRHRKIIAKLSYLKYCFF
jgi:hypothetical protein